jgi:hypothetical protein
MALRVLSYQTALASKSLFGMLMVKGDTTRVRRALAGHDSLPFIARLFNWLPSLFALGPHDRYWPSAGTHWHLLLQVEDILNV